MRILDKNTDFYDYLQNMYPDTSITFDRTDSFLLTKEIMCEHLRDYRGYRSWKNPFRYILLQVCNTFWLFLVEITETTSYDEPKNYAVELLTTWKNYDKPRALMKLDVITFDYTVDSAVRDYDYKAGGWVYDKSKIEKRLPALVQAVDTNNIRIQQSINKHTIYHGSYENREEKHLPLLKACGLGSCINPLEIYLSFEEYFSLEKTAGERTESVGLTDVEKIGNHGFSTKDSFRGKPPQTKWEEQS